MAFVTNFIGVIVSVTLNLILIPLIGTMGATIANAFSYFVLWIVRIFNTGRIVRIKYDIVRVVLSTLIIIAQAVLVCADLDLYITYSVCAAATVAVVLIYFKHLMSILKFSLSFVKKIVKRG